jgi:hypothetical protein
MGGRPAARVALRAAPAAELLEVGRGDAGLLVQLAPGAVDQAGVALDVDKAAGQRPSAWKGFARRVGAANQQDLQRIVAHGEDDEVDSDQRPGEVKARRRRGWFQGSAPLGLLYSTTPGAQI